MLSLFVALSPLMLAGNDPAMPGKGFQSTGFSISRESQIFWTYKFIYCIGQIKNLALLFLKFSLIIHLKPLLGIAFVMWQLNTFPRVCPPLSYFTFPTSRAGRLVCFFPSDVPILVSSIQNCSNNNSRFLFNPRLFLFYFFLAYFCLQSLSSPGHLKLAQELNSRKQDDSPE